MKKLTLVLVILLVLVSGCALFLGPIGACWYRTSEHGEVRCNGMYRSECYDLEYMIEFRTDMTCTTD